jgi:hypothetical protein
VCLWGPSLHKNLMFIISNYTINPIGYPGKYHACEIEAATMGSRLTTRAYYLIVLWARQGVTHVLAAATVG